jgi:hypothetical protein
MELKMIKKIFFLFFFIFTLFSISTIADYQTLYSDNFDYCSNDYTTRSWYFSTSAGNWSEYPIYNSNLGSCAYGYNNTQTGSIGNYFSTRLVQNPSTSLYNGLIHLSFTIDASNSTLSHSSNRLLSVLASNSTSATSYNNGLIYFNIYDDNINITREYSSTNKLRLCGLNLIRPYTIDISWYIDTNLKTTSLYIYNRTSGEIILECENQNFYNMSYDGGETNINKFAFLSNNEAGRTYGIFLDDFKVEIANMTTTGALPSNSYCDLDTDCYTGYCLNSKCSPKTFDMICNAGYECLSGNCINSHCTKEDLLQSTDNFWISLGIVSVGSKLLIGLIIIVVITLIVAFTTANMIAIGVSSIASLFVVVYLGLFPIWIVVLIIIMCAVGFFAFFSGGK